jgi:hypothetical protein
MPARCVFCGSTATLTNAHVLAKPIRAAFDDPAVTGSIVYRESRQADGSHAPHSHTGNWREVKAKAECFTCNSGWTGQIEESVSAILPKLIHGQEIEVAPQEQQALATWSVLTMLLLQCTHSRAARLVIPPSDYASFFAVKSPTPLMKVVTAYAEPPGRRTSVEAAVEYLAEDRGMADVARLLESDGLAAPVDMRAYTATLRLGFWVTHIMRFGSPDFVARLGHGPALSPYLFTVWPTQSTRAWPPRSLAEIGGIMALARSIDGGVAIA